MVLARVALEALYFPISLYIPGSNEYLLISLVILSCFQ